MLRKGGSSNQAEASTAIQEVLPKTEAVMTSIFLLTSTNYHLRAMRKEVHLEAPGLWEVITWAETNQKKDQQAFSAILSSVMSHRDSSKISRRQ